MKDLEIIGRVDVKPARTLLHCLPKLWTKITFRQDHPLSPHKHTRTIYLRWPKSFSARAALYDRDFEDKPDLVHPAFRNLLAAVEELIGEKAERAILVNLLPGGVITPHIDQGPHAEATERWHCCLETNFKASLHAGIEITNLLPGDVCYFNKHAMHSARNDGKTDRIHLIVDTAK